MPEVKGIYYVISWVVVCIGWLVVNQQNNRREERKEIRASLGDIHKEVDDLVAMSIAYHKKNSHSPDDSKAIRLKMHKVGFKILHLHFHSDKVNRAIYELRHSITFKNFDTWKHQAQTDASEIVEGIYYQSDVLLNELENYFGKLYRQGFRRAIAHEWRRFLGMVQSPS